MTRTNVLFVSTAIALLGVGSAATAQSPIPARWSDSQFIEASKCLTLAKETKAENATQWNELIRVQKRGREAFVEDQAFEAGQKVKRLVRQSKGGAETVPELEQIKATCASYSV